MRPFRRRPKAAPGEPPGERPPRSKPKHRRKKRKIAALGLAVLVLATSVSVVGSVFYATVDLPESLDDDLSQGSTVYYSDGTTVMGELAAEQRTSVDLDEIADDLENAVVAAEDANFYEHPGVDAKGVLRAIVNNVKGGDQQGASTLTQQYVGLVADIRGDGSYFRKAREAAMAMKMEEEFTKDEILNHYLNIVYFGRGAYGAEAAAQAFFGRSAAELSTSQSALLVAQIKSPDGPYDPRDPYGKGGNVEEATERWEYVLDQMVATGRLEQVKRDAITELPETLDPTNDPEGLGPEGFITNGFVLQELAAAGIGTEEVLRGGFEIVTTLDADLQELAVEQTGIREVAAEDENMAAALTALEPGTGRVLAYYGGENGAGLDLAADVGHRPGTSFNTVVLAAAVESGIDPWSPDLDGSSPRQFETYLDEHGEPIDLVNIGGAQDHEVSLADAVAQKLDTPVYDISEALGGNAIAQTAAGLGIDRMWDPHDVDEHGVAAEIDPGGNAEFHPDIGIGAYPITTLDAAVMHGTLAAVGTVAEPYFVDHVNGADGRLYKADPQVEEGAFDPGAAAEATAPMYSNTAEAGIFADPNDRGDFDVAVNASSTWHTGFSTGLSLAVWAGDEKKEGDGSSHEGTVAERIWWQVMQGRPDKYRWDPEQEAALLEEQQAKEEEAEAEQWPPEDEPVAPEESQDGTESEEEPGQATESPVTEESASPSEEETDLGWLGGGGD
ncbi:transglycosylase domain-containing protein [Glycomyces luteolus]|uniref:Transglycosylase domain-containing protein n=1 Tax=Glycomyces luteolus TaxID=2670330 RepID=A0A9X3PAP3_9ACTN|nr:transglycosylase domain-containing protein [Glycomyces luteolus]